MKHSRMVKVVKSAEVCFSGFSNLLCEAQTDLLEMVLSILHPLMSHLID